MSESKQFKFIKTNLPDVYVIDKSIFSDNRGNFIKIFNANDFNSTNLDTSFKEAYYSYSHKNVIRGMHYQKHPYGHAKLISVIDGKILDVCVGIKKRNKGKYFAIELSKKNNKSLYIPDGYAHGFLVLSKYAVVLNQTTSVYNQEYDTGIAYNSFDYIWPIKTPILSEKDKNLVKLNNIK